MQATPPTRPPDLSIVLGTHAGLERLGRVIQCLDSQTIRDRIELIVVASAEEHLGENGLPESRGFHSIKAIHVGPIENVDRALAHGVRAAKAPVVALLEDHAFPEANWAEVLVEAHRGPWAAVGTNVTNGNPSRALSWANMLIAYGSWLSLEESAEVETFSRHNCAYKRDVLLTLGSRLDDMLVRGGGLVEALQDAGQRFYVEARSSVAHVNPSRLQSTAHLRFNAGRLYGARRAGGWPFAKRLLFAGLAPPLRLQKIVRRAWGKRRAVPRRPSIAFAFLASLLLDGLGETMGYLAGPGRAGEELAVFEMDREAHVTAADRHILVTPGRA